MHIPKLSGFYIFFLLAGKSDRAYFLYFLKNCMKKKGIELRSVKTLCICVVRIEWTADRVLEKKPAGNKWWNTACVLVLGPKQGGGAGRRKRRRRRQRRTWSLTSLNSKNYTTTTTHNTPPPPPPHTIHTHTPHTYTHTHTHTHHTIITLTL